MIISGVSIGLIPGLDPGGKGPITGSAGKGRGIIVPGGNTGVTGVTGVITMGSSGDGITGVPLIGSGCPKRCPCPMCLKNRIRPRYRLFRRSFA